METERKLLAVFAHPDDETFICGGTLARFAKEGVRITLVSATKGEMGRRMGKPPFVNRETMPALREQELRKACGILGIQDLRFLGIRDKLVEFEPLEKLVGRIVTVIRELRPQVVLTFHEKIGGHPDHCAIGKAATLAFQQAGDPNRYPEHRGQGLKPFAPERLYFISFGEAMKRPERYGFLPEQITRIDVSACRAEKMRAFRAHRSQTELDSWLWGSDSDVMRKFSGEEYFIQGNMPFRKGERDLFPEQRDGGRWS